MSSAQTASPLWGPIGPAGEEPAAGAPQPQPRVCWLGPGLQGGGRAAEEEGDLAVDVLRGALRRGWARPEVALGPSTPMSRRAFWGGLHVKSGRLLLLQPRPLPPPSPSPSRPAASGRDPASCISTGIPTPIPQTRPGFPPNGLLLWLPRLRDSTSPSHRGGIPEVASPDPVLPRHPRPRDPHVPAA